MTAGQLSCGPALECGTRLIVPVTRQIRIMIGDSFLVQVDTVAVLIHEGGRVYGYILDPEITEEDLPGKPGMPGAVATGT